MSENGQREIYHYSLIGFSPHPDRGEVFNLGFAIVADDGSYRDAFFRVGHKTRLRALAPDVHPNAIDVFIEDFRARFGHEQMAGGELGFPSPLEYLEEMADYRDSQVVFSPPKAIIARDPSLAMSQLRNLYTDAYSIVGEAGPTKLDRSYLRRKAVGTFRMLKVPSQHIQLNPEMNVRHGTNHLAIGIMSFLDVSQLVLAVEPISFRLKTVERILRQRDHLAWVASDLVDPEASPRISAFVSSPTRSNRNLYKESLDLLNQLQVTVVENASEEQLGALALETGALPEL